MCFFLVDVFDLDCFVYQFLPGSDEMINAHPAVFQPSELVSLRGGIVKRIVRDFDIKFTRLILPTVLHVHLEMVCDPGFLASAQH